MRDIQAIQTLRLIANIQLWVAAIIGAIVLFSSFVETGPGPFGERTVRLGFNLPGFVIGLVVLMAGLLFWSIGMVLASMAASLLVLRDHFEPIEGFSDGDEDDYENEG